MTIKFYAVDEDSGRRVQIQAQEEDGFTLTCVVKTELGEVGHEIPDGQQLFDMDEAVNEAEIHLEHGKCPHLGDVL